MVVKCRTRGNNVDKNLTNSANIYDTRHSVRTPLSVIDQSVTPEQGIRQFSKGVLHSRLAANLESNKMTSDYNNVNNIGHPMTTHLSRSDERVPPNISLRSSRGMFSSSRTGEQSTNQFLRIISPNVPVKEHNSKNAKIQNINSSGNSSLIFSIPESCVTTVHKQKGVKKKSVADSEEEQNPSKRFCGKLSPGPSSFNTANVKSTFEKGESSRKKNLMNEFNDVDDNVTIDSDTTCGDMASDIENIDEEYLSNNQSMWEGYLNLGAPDKIFVLDKEKQPPEPLATLLTGGVHFKHFKKNIRFYNCMFAMRATGGKINHSINRGGTPYCFKVQGVNYHNIGSLVPTDDNTPKFCQLYIYDTEDEINNRINAVNGCRDAVNEEIVQSLLHMLDEHNSLASGRPNHIAPSNEVAGLIVTSPYAKGCRDTVIDSRVDGLQRIFETDPCFIYYREILLNRPVKHSKRDIEVTGSEDPDEKGLTPHLGGRLWQQYVVDAFTAIEQDVMQKGDRNPSNIGKAIILPASFTGSKRYMTQYFKDSLAICQTLGHPSLFLTMTTNTKWPEIQRMLKHMSGVDVADAPDVVARVFKMKVDQLMDMIKKKNCFGRCIGVMHVIEFQKCGLPHAHILIWLHPDDRPKITEQIDKMVSVKIPNSEIDPVGYNAGHDTATMCLRKTRTGTSATIPKKAPKGPIDEVKHYLDGRYVCVSEASWRIFAFDIHSRWPSVERLPIHLPGGKHFSFKAGYVLEDACDKHPRPGIWKERKRGDVIRRLSEVHSSSGELLYLRMLLLRKKGSRSFEDLKTVNGHIHETFKEACTALGLLQNDNQWHEVIAENSHTSLPPQLRAMFVNI
ncbi:uncharacterized protein LOC141665319 [Apium graveolens]|uniref:uncharacterized protein LOC141665319 n=1 Tax=Apium graveolens TaxID=4045 RepID=UPI003D79D86C